MQNKPVLGIDIGGSGIKGALVDLVAGDFATDRVRIPTPAESTPANVASIVAEIVAEFAGQMGDGPIGITIPAVVTHGITRSAANIHKSWIDAPAEKIFADHLGREVVLVNDADAAGVAEVMFGAAKGNQGLVLVTTLGTGNSGTSRSTATTRRPRRRPRSRPRSACPTTSTSRGCSATTRTWSHCSGPTCSWSAAGSRRPRTSSCRD
jgi:N-acetylglucosamine kinase-like BadF-type ATPase